MSESVDASRASCEGSVPSTEKSRMEENRERCKSSRIGGKLNRVVRGRGRACLIRLLRHWPFEGDLERDEANSEMVRKGMIRFEGELRRLVRIHEGTSGRKGEVEVVEVQSGEYECYMSESEREI